MTNEPWLSAPARLGWELVKTPNYFEPPEVKPDGQVLQFRPALQGGLDLAGKFPDITLDLSALIESAQKPGGYFVINCSCGCADDAGIMEMIFVSHPDANTIFWELDLEGLKSAWEQESWIPDEPGFLRLTFRRDEYEADLRSMVVEVQQANAVLEVDELQPGDYRAVEAILNFNIAAPFTRQPVLPPGSELQFRFEGSECCWLNGSPFRNWPGRLFPRWRVNRAFKIWIGFVERGYASKDLYHKINYFYLLDEANRDACDAAGVALATALQAAFDEGATAPRVRVSCQRMWRD